MFRFEHVAAAAAEVTLPLISWRATSRDYLGEATCGSRTQLDCHERALGDAGYKTLLSICRALSSPVSRGGMGKFDGDTTMDS